MENWVSVVFRGEVLEGYQVSDLGRVRSVARVVVGKKGRPLSVRERILKQSQIRGYSVVTLSRHGTAYVHRLVLESFVGPPPEGWQARHFPDPTTTNNALSNLRWGTVQQNHDDKVEQERQARGGTHGSAKITDAEAMDIFRRATDPNRTETYEQIGRSYKVGKSMVCHIVKGRARSWQTGVPGPER